MSETAAHFEGRMEVRPGREEEFALWQDRYRKIVSKRTGLLSSELVLPGPGSRTWSIRLAFDRADSLASWLCSAERTELLAEVAPLAATGMTTRLSAESDSSLGVTEAFFTRVRAESQREYQLWQTKIHQVQNTFPGYRGMVFQPPVKGQKDWTTLLSFDTVEHLETWLESEQRKHLLEELSSYAESVRQWRVPSSFPGWVPPAPAGAEQPAHWKSSMLVVVGLFPLVMLQMRYLNPWLLEALPLSPATMLANILSVALISYVTMPVCIRSFRWWLYPSKDGPHRSALGTLVVLAAYIVEVAMFWNLDSSV